MPIAERKEFINKFTKVLEEVSTEQPMNGSRRNNLRAYFKKKAEADPSAKPFYDAFLKKQRDCWGI